MMVTFILGILFFIVGTVAIVKGLLYKDPYLLSLGAILWIGFCIFEITAVKYQIKDLQKKKRGGDKSGV